VLEKASGFPDAFFVWGVNEFFLDATLFLLRNRDAE
jgi:hypothetical protein